VDPREDLDRLGADAEETRGQRRMLARRALAVVLRADDESPALLARPRGEFGVLDFEDEVADRRNVAAERQYAD
jgi:hypothetical protein